MGIYIRVSAAILAKLEVDPSSYKEEIVQVTKSHLKSSLAETSVTERIKWIKDQNDRYEEIQKQADAYSKMEKSGKSVADKLKWMKNQNVRRNEKRAHTYESLFSIQ